MAQSPKLSQEEEEEKAALILDASVLKSCEDAYHDRENIINPRDSRLTELEVSMHTCMLKVAGAIREQGPRKWSERPTRQERAKMIDKKDKWAKFRKLYKRSKGEDSILGFSEWRELGEHMFTLAKRTIEKASVVIATTAQSSLPLLSDEKFDRNIVDESSNVPFGNLLSAWKPPAILIMIGDTHQLATQSRAEKDQNMFSRVYEYSAFERFMDLGLPIFMLKEQYRMKCGLMMCSNDLCYQNRLMDGVGTEVVEGTKRISSRHICMQSFLTLRWNSKTRSSPFCSVFQVTASPKEVGAIRKSTDIISWSASPCSKVWQKKSGQRSSRNLPLSVDTLTKVGCGAIISCCFLRNNPASDGTRFLSVPSDIGKGKRPGS